MSGHKLPMIYPEQWNEEFARLETQLTVYQLLLLLSLDAHTDHTGIYEPVWPLLTAGAKPAPLKNAVLLDEGTLLEAAQARALERLGLTELNSGDERWELTAKGIAAARFWRGALADHSRPDELKT
jgi:hypothetical protein